MWRGRLLQGIYPAEGLFEIVRFAIRAYNPFYKQKS